MSSALSRYSLRNIIRLPAGAEPGAVLSSADASGSISWTPGQPSSNTILSASNPFDATQGGGLYQIASDFVGPLTFPAPSTLEDFVGATYTFVLQDPSKPLQITSAVAPTKVFADSKFISQETVTVNGRLTLQVLQAADVPNALLTTENQAFTATLIQTTDFSVDAALYNVVQDAVIASGDLRFSFGAAGATQGAAWVQQPFRAAGESFDKSFSVRVVSEDRSAAPGMAVCFQNDSVGAPLTGTDGYSTAGEYVAFNVECARGGGGFVRIGAQSSSGQLQQAIGPGGPTFNSNTPPARIDSFGDRTDPDPLVYWVDYDASTNLVQMFGRMDGLTTKPAAPFASFTSDLSAIFTPGPAVYIGLTGRTQGGGGELDSKRFDEFSFEIPA